MISAPTPFRDPVKANAREREREPYRIPSLIETGIGLFGVGVRGCLPPLCETATTRKENGRYILT